MDDQFQPTQPTPPTPPTPPASSYSVAPPVKNSGKKSTLIIVVLLLLAAAAVYGVYAMQQSKIDDVNKVVTKLSAENDDLRYQLKALNSNTIVGAVEGGTSDQLAAKIQLVDFYKNWSSVLRTKPKDPTARIAAVSDFLTDAAKKQYQQPLNYDLFTCNASLLQQIIVYRPSVSGAKATSPVLPVEKIGVSGAPPAVKNIFVVSLVKQNSKWLVDSVSCPTS